MFLFRNLQAAICSYIDFGNPFNTPCMTLICDSTIGEGEAVPPNTNFQKSWRVQNSGTETWPNGIHLQHSSGVQMGCARIPVPPLAPKETTELSVTLKSPAETGVHQSKWRMMTTNGVYFGGMSRILRISMCDRARYRKRISESKSV